MYRYAATASYGLVVVFQLPSPIHVVSENSLFYRSGAQYKITRYFSRKIEQLIIIKIKLFQQIVARIRVFMGGHGMAWNGLLNGKRALSRRLSFIIAESIKVDCMS